MEESLLLFINRYIKVKGKLNKEFKNKTYNNLNEKNKLKILREIRQENDRISIKIAREINNLNFINKVYDELL